MFGKIKTTFFYSLIRIKSKPLMQVISSSAGASNLAEDDKEFSKFLSFVFYFPLDDRSNNFLHLNAFVQL